MHGLSRGLYGRPTANDAIYAPFDRTQVDEQDLILAMVDDLAQQVAASSQVGTRELALEYRVLEVVSKATHRLMNLAQPQVVCNVVADQVRRAHSRRISERTDPFFTDPIGPPEP